MSNEAFSLFKMLSRAIIVCLFGLFSVEFVKMDKPVQVQFDINVKYNKMFCAHTLEKHKEHTYTVREGKYLEILVNYNKIINYIRCADLHRSNTTFIFPQSYIYLPKIKVDKKMGALWNCTIFAHKYNTKILPVVEIEGDSYSAAYCYMQIHVRLINAPQSILVNKMALEPVRTSLSEKEFDFTTEYNYADGDIVDVSCINLNTSGQLSMEYKYADKLSDVFTNKQLSSVVGVGFRAKLHSEHSDTNMICNYKTSNDYTKVVVKFVMQSKFENITTVKINGMIMRPKHKQGTYTEIEYECISNEKLEVLCEIDLNRRKDLKLVVADYRLSKSNDSMAEIISYPNTKTSLVCGADYKTNDHVAHKVRIIFTPNDKLIDPCPFHIDLLPNNVIMELYENHRLKILYYEFESGETLMVKCYSTCTPGPITYIESKINNTAKKISNDMSEEIQLTPKSDNTAISFYLKEQKGNDIDSTNDPVFREIRVIFREKTMTPFTTSLPDISSLPSTVTKEIDTIKDGYNSDGNMKTLIPAAAGAVICIVVTCISIIVFKWMKRSRSQEGPHERNYLNLQSQSEYTNQSQLESNYTVPVDRREEDASYSVSYRPEGALYSIPIPKCERKKRKNKIEPTYASLDIKINKKGQRENTCKDLEDPSYTECVYKMEQCYAKVLPKSERKTKDNNPYANVTNEPPYVNRGNICPEPTYCEPNGESISQKNPYANVLNNTRYVNSPDQEYVEPTYCEPNKQNQ